MYVGDKRRTSESDELCGRLIEKYQEVQKERNSLREQLEKHKIAAETDLNIAKEQNKKLSLENSALSKTNKDLRSEIQNVEFRLKSKEKETKELQTRLEMKGAIDQRNSDRDHNLFRTMFGRNAVTTNSYDSKILSIIKKFENRIQSLELENSELRRSVDENHKKEHDFNMSRKNLEKEREVMGDKFNAELRQQLDRFEQENTLLLREKESQRERLDMFEQEVSRLRRNNFDMKEAYDELRREYSRVAESQDAQVAQKANVSPAKKHSSHPVQKHQDKYENDAHESNNNSQHHHEQHQSPPIEGANEGHTYSLRPFCNLSELTILECRRIIAEVMDVFTLKSPVQVVPSIKQAERAIQAIPRLQNFLSEITELVLENIGLPNDFQYVDQVVPTVKRWIIEGKEREALLRFRGRCTELLEIPEHTSDKDIISKIEEELSILKELQRRVKDSSRDDNENKRLLSHFSQLFGVEPTIGFFMSISNQLKDINHFMSLIRDKLNLDPNMRNEACLTYLLKFLDNISKEDKEGQACIDIVRSMQKILSVPQNQLLISVEK